MDSQNQIAAHTDKNISFPVANLLHTLRTHCVGLVWTIAATLFAGSFAIFIVTTQAANLLSNALLFLILAAIVAMVGLTAKSLIIPCRCGKEVRSRSAPSRLRMALEMRAARRLPFYWLSLALPSLILTAFLTDVILGDTPEFMPFVRIVRLTAVFCIMNVSLAILIGVDSKWFRDRLKSTLVLTEAGFSEQSLDDKSEDELNALIGVALQNGLTEQADLVSRHLLDKVHRIS